jgi:hypothetical protein
MPAGGGKMDGMSDRSPVRSILGGAAVVALSGLAAYLGASLASRGTASVAAPPAPAGIDPAQIESLERRLKYVEHRVDLLELRAGAANDAAPATSTTPAPAAAPPKTVAHDPAAPAVPVPPVDDGADGQLAKLRDVSRATTRNVVVYQMSLMSDATTEGAANRLAQARLDARALMSRFALRGDELQDKLAKIYLDQWETSARDVGPIVRDGLEKADITTVKERLRGIHAATDKSVRPLLDDETWKQYESVAAAARKSAEGVLDEFEKTRLGH